MEPFESSHPFLNFTNPAPLKYPGAASLSYGWRRSAENWAIVEKSLRDLIVQRFHVRPQKLELPPESIQFDLNPGCPYALPALPSTKSLPSFDAEMVSSSKRTYFCEICEKPTPPRRFSPAKALGRKRIIDHITSFRIATKSMKMNALCQSEIFLSFKCLFANFSLDIYQSKIYNLQARSVAVSSRG